MLSIVADTNQFLSGFIYHGMLKTVFDLVLDKKLELSVSSELKTEIHKKLHEFKVDEKVQNEVMNFIETQAIFIEPTVKVVICRDPEDNFVLELAETAKADYLVTRDKDLLVLKTWKNVIIISPENFLGLLRSRKLIS